MDDKKKNKKYVVPEADLVEFADEDIITASAGGAGGTWGGDDNTEVWPKF